MEFVKIFSSCTRMRPKPVGWLSRLNRSHVALEDPRFNQVVTVTSSDQIEARYPVTPAMMERLRALRLKLGDVSVAFSARHLYLAVDRPYDLFDPNPAEPFNGTAQVTKMLRNLSSMFARIGLLTTGT